MHDKPDARLPAEGILQHCDPPPSLATDITGFVYRDDQQGGDVVRVLPEVRSSIQVMVADPYWLRPRAADAVWARVPKVSLWGPKYEWCYGYAQKHIKAYAIALAPKGLLKIAGAPASSLLNDVVPLASVNQKIAKEVMPLAAEPFDAWKSRVTSFLETYLTKDGSPLPDLDKALRELTKGEKGSVRNAAELAGLSERQFRRVFKMLYGVPPKQYQRALRVDRMIRTLHANPWEGDALHEYPVHFSDQPHEIREFKTLIGLTPRQYIAAKSADDRTIRSVITDEVDPPET